MSYPFTTFPLVNRVGVTNPYAAVDARYGPWNTRNDALTSFNAGLRSQGLTLGIIESGRVVEYWYRDGVSDSNLVLKTPDINISGYLPLSGGIISGNFSVSGTLSGIRTAFLENLNVQNVLSSTYIQHIDKLTLDSNKIIFKNSYPWLETSLFYENSSASSITLKSGTNNNVGGISISSLKLEVQSPIEVQNTLKVEGNFSSEKIAPSGSILFQDLFIRTGSTTELITHLPNIGTNWTRILQSTPSAMIFVYPDINEAKAQISEAFQGVIYMANANYTSANYEVKVSLNEISPVDPSNFDVFWVLGRIQDSNNFYAVRFGVQSQDCVLFRKFNGTFTSLKQFSWPNPNFRNNLNVSLRFYENNISVFFNDFLVASVEDNSVTVAGRAGLGIGNIGVRGNDSIDHRTRFKSFTVTRYSEFEKDSYIFNNDFGIGTKTPNEKLTVSGNISSNNLIYSLGGNSQQWNSNFTTVCTLSSQWSQGTNIIPVVTNYLSTNNVFFSSVSIVSGSNSFRWTEAYTAVAANSATTWNYQGTDVKNLTSKYENLLTFITNTSANWEESAEIIPTVTNYLSTNQVQVSSLIAQNGVYDAGYFWNQYVAPNNNTWTSITYGNGLFVAIANSNVVTPNKIMTSPDGINWTLREVPIQNNWVSIVYGNGLFVAVADDGSTNERVLISSNGINWRGIQVPPFSFKSIAYGDGRFVAVAQSSATGFVEKIITSTDGENWQVGGGTIANQIDFTSVTYGNGWFVAVGESGTARIIRSSDGISWSTPLGFILKSWKSVVYGNGIFLITSNDGTVARLTGGNVLAGSNVSYITDINLFGGKLYYSQGLYFLISPATGVWISLNGIDWNKPKNLISGSWFNYGAITYGNGIFVLVGSGLPDNNNIFVSGKQKINNDFGINPLYGGLSLYGNLTANNLVIASSGNSQLWTEVYSRVAANSSTWNAAGSPNVSLSSIFSTVCSLSANWNSVYNTTCALSTNWSSVYSYWNPLTANTASAVTFINNNSSNLPSVITKVNTTSANWDSTYTTLCSLSSKWNIPYDTVLNINSTNAVENSAVAVKIQELQNGLNILVPAPTYILPQATLTNFSAPNQIYEVGDIVVQTLTLGYTQNDAGNATNFRLERNNFTVAQQSNSFNFNVNEIVVLGTTTYRNTVTYVDGPVKNNILGIPDNRGRILAGTVSLNRNYIGRYIQFYGSVALVPVNLRTLPLSSFDNVNTFSIQATQNNTVLAIPNTKTLSLARTENFQNVTNDFVMTNVSVNNANGVPVSYKRYVLTTSVPFNVRIDFTLT